MFRRYRRTVSSDAVTKVVGLVVVADMPELGGCREILRRCGGVHGATVYTETDEEKNVKDILSNSVAKQLSEDFRDKIVIRPEQTVVPMHVIYWSKSPNLIKGFYAVQVAEEDGFRILQNSEFTAAAFRDIGTKIAVASEEDARILQIAFYYVMSRVPHRAVVTV